METAIDSKKRGRFVVESRSPGLFSVISEHASFTEAEAYRDLLGVKGVQVEYVIVDKSKNLVQDVADDSAMESLDRQIEIARKRKQLLDMTEENKARESVLKGETLPPVGPNI